MFDVLLISLISLIWLTTLFCDKICNCWNNSSYLPWLSTQAPHVDSWTTKFPSQDTESVRPAGWVELFSKHTKSWWALPSEFRADEAMRPNLSQEVLERREQNDKGHFVNSLWMFYVDKENTWKETTREKRRLHHITCTSWNLRHRTLDAPGWKSEQTNNIVFQLGLHHVNCCRNHQHCTWSFKGGRSRTLAHVDSRADKLHTEATLPWLLLLKGLFTHSPGYKNYLPVWLINGFNSQLQFSLIFPIMELKYIEIISCRGMPRLQYALPFLRCVLVVREHIPDFNLMKDLVSSLRSRFAEPQMLPPQRGIVLKKHGIASWEKLDADGMVIDGQQLVD